jgi:hypothetical protein
MNYGDYSLSHPTMSRLLFCGVIKNTNETQFDFQYCQKPETFSIEIQIAFASFCDFRSKYQEKQGRKSVSLLK